jgi:hypothetical protein
MIWHKCAMLATFHPLYLLSTQKDCDTISKASGRPRTNLTDGVSINYHCVQAGPMPVVIRPTPSMPAPSCQRKSGTCLCAPHFCLAVFAGSQVVIQEKAVVRPDPEHHIAVSSNIVANCSYPSSVHGDGCRAFLFGDARFPSTVRTFVCLRAGVRR